MGDDDEKGAGSGDEDKGGDGDEEQADASDGGEQGTDGELEDDDSILMAVHPFPNALALTYRAEKGVMSFVKDINHTAPSSKADFNQVWSVKDDDGDEKGGASNDNKHGLDSQDKATGEPPAKRQKR